MIRLAALLLLPALAGAQETVGVGSKRFTESYILGEIVARTVVAAGEAGAVHKPGLGNTAILFAALKSGAIDIYPEYTGTIALELLRLHRVPDLPTLNRELARHGLAAGIPLGFANTYSLAMRENQATVLGISRISDLARFPGLRLGLTQEFLHRKDGWGALKSAYRLPHVPAGLDHGLAYDALAAGQLDVIDVYTTDAKIGRDRLTLLADDRAFFPAYEAVLLYRDEFSQRFPRTWRALQALEGRIPASRMIEMNGAVELSGLPFTRVAAGFLEGPSVEPAGAPAHDQRFRDMLFGPDFWRLTGQHAVLVFVSLMMSIGTGVPLGMLAARHPATGFWILGTAGILQTVPSLALLAFLIAAFDRIGTVPAVVALFLYGLLPIVRNTEAGFNGGSPTLRQSALALGLSRADQLRLVELPLAFPSILAGIRISAVINVGTATIAAFIGAGGYGERIVAGLAVNDHRLLLAGAIPAAAMALVIEGVFSSWHRLARPPGG